MERRRSVVAVGAGSYSDHGVAVGVGNGPLAPGMAAPVRSRTDPRWTVFPGPAAQIQDQCRKQHNQVVVLIFSPFRLSEQSVTESLQENS